MSNQNTSLVADKVEAVAAIREAAGEHLPLCRFPSTGEPTTPEAIRSAALADDLGLRVSALGDLLAWAAANPKAGAELAARLGGDPNITTHEGGSSSEILVLPDGNALLWSDIRGVIEDGGYVLIRTTGDPLLLDPGTADPCTQCDPVHQSAVIHYRDELVAQWQERRA